jgi:hypothetical protein
LNNLCIFRHTWTDLSSCQAISDECGSKTPYYDLPEHAAIIDHL